MFAEDLAIPGEVVARLWAHTGGWPAFQARRLCRRSFDSGLLAGYRRDRDRLVLHGVIRSYLRNTGRAQRAGWDAAVVDVHRDLLPAGGGGRHRARELHMRERADDRVVGSGRVDVDSPNDPRSGTIHSVGPVAVPHFIVRADL